MYLKRFLIMFLSLFLIFGVVTSCSNSTGSTEGTAEKDGKDGNDGKDGKDGKDGTNATNGTNDANDAENQDNLKPAVGKIYYSDGTASYSYYEDKTPVGFVVSINKDGTVNTIVALTEYDTSIYFEFTDSTYSVNTTDNDGEENCKIIIDGGHNPKAVAWCRNYDSGVEGFGKGKWYLPAKMELMTIAENQDVFIESELALVKNGYTGALTRFHNSYYWSSTQYQTTISSTKDRCFWVVNPKTCAETFLSKTTEHYIRPMYKFHYDE